MTQQLLLKRFGICGLALMMPLTLMAGCSQQSSTPQASEPTATAAATNTTSTDDQGFTLRIPADATLCTDTIGFIEAHSSQRCPSGFGNSLR